MNRIYSSFAALTLLTTSLAPNALQASNSKAAGETLGALLGFYFDAGGILNVGLAGGESMSLSDEFRRTLDLDTADFRDRPIFRGNEKPKAGGPEVALGFDWNRFFVIYSGRYFVGNVDTTAYTSSPPFQALNVRTTTYKDAGMNPRDLLMGARFFLGDHTIQVHGGARSMVEDTTFTERSAPLTPGSLDITDAAANRFKVRTTGALAGAGYRYEFKSAYLFAELSAFQVRGSYSMNIASFESTAGTRLREISVDMGRVNGFGAEATLGAALGKRFGPRIGIRRTVLRTNFHREAYLVYDPTRAAPDLTAQAIYLSRIRNKRGVRTASNSAFIEMRFAADFGKDRGND